MTTKTKRYTLDGEPVTLADLRAENEDGAITASDWKMIHEMQPGNFMTLGGGAGAEFVLRRES